MAVQSHPAYAEESAHLEQTLAVIRAERGRAEEDFLNAEEELRQARASDPDKLPVREILFMKAAQDKRCLELALVKPYFTRINFTEQDGDRRVYYIGKSGVTANATLESVVIDWRAPLANLYYSGQLGQVEYIAPDGTVRGELTLKRQFDIENGALQSIFDTDIVSQDAYLQNALNQMNGQRLKEIVTTIQAEQNCVIRHPLRQSLIVQGVAGSGKTTIALHRIAYLLYAFRDRLQPQNMMILAPNPLFLNYIAGVLPDLGVERVRQTTFPLLIREWAGEPLKRVDFSDRTERVFRLSATQRDQAARIAHAKGSLALADALNDFLGTYEARFSPAEGIAFGPIRLWTKEEMDQFLFVDEAPFPMARRLAEFKKQLNKRASAAAARLEKWFMEESARRADLLRQQVSDPASLKARLNHLYASRDARIRETRQQVKPFVENVMRALPCVDPLALYREFWVSRREDAAWREAADSTLSRLEAGLPPEPEDAAPLAYLAMKLTELPRFDIRHIVIDEAQDFSPLEFLLLTRMMPAATFTVVGDLMQGIHGWRGLKAWQELVPAVLGPACALRQLATSYRSTIEIMETALRVANHRPVPGQTAVRSVIRHGEAPVFCAFSRHDEQLALIAQTVILWQAAGLRSIAIIERRADRLADLRDGLPAALGAQLLDIETEQELGGVLIAPAFAVKGLEFDGVIIADASEEAYPDTDLEARLLYVALTRPLHRLHVLYKQALTPLLAQSEQ